MSIKSRLYQRLGPAQYIKLRRVLYAWYGFVYRNNLPALGRAFNSDKATFHSYAKHYQSHFEAIRNQRLNILEIGIGGYEDSLAGGESLRMWKAYFPHSRVYGIDIHDKSLHNERRITTYQGSQIDRDFLDRVVNSIGGLDIVIDDGSHVNSHVIETFSFLFPRLNIGGIYAIEDLQTSYWDETVGGWGGSKDLDATFTSMNFLKRLADGLNHKEYIVPGYKPSFFDQYISSIHFYHNLAVIYKDHNSEPSNLSTFLLENTHH